MAHGASHSTRPLCAVRIARCRRRRKKPMRALDFDPSSLRDWLAAVGLLRLVSETTDNTRLVWRLVAGRYRVVVDDGPDDLAQRCADWVAVNKGAWQFAGRQNVDFDAEFWRERALAANTLEAALWCAVASDAVP